MKSIRLKNDPFALRVSCSYKTRTNEIKKRYSPDNYKLAERNLKWICKRALVVLLSVETESAAEEIQNLDSIESICDFCQQTGCGTIRDLLLDKGYSVDKGDQKFDGMLKKADRVQELVYKNSGKDIYKRIKDYPLIDKASGYKSEILEDITDL